MSLFTFGTQRKDAPPKPRVQLSVGVLFVVAAILLIGTIFFGAPIEIAMFIAFVVMMLILAVRGFSFEEIESAAYDSMRSVLVMILILLSVGMLISSWAEAGTIPLIIKLGVQAINPVWFYTTAILLCSATSLVTGTSWGTIGSVGVALMAIGNSLGLPPAVTAGAIISGAYFGDKMSLLSDTTNLSAAITKTPIMTHIKYMLITTTPAYILTLIAFQAIGFTYSSDGDRVDEINTIVNGLDASFDLSWYTLLPAVVTVSMLIFRLPPYVAIFGGVLGAMFISVTLQDNDMSDAIATIYTGFTLDSGLTEIDDLISGGGMLSMSGISFLFLFAVGVAGLLEKGGFTTSIIERLLKIANTRRKLMTMSSPLTIFAIGLGANFSFAAVMIGTLLTPAYKKMGLKSQNLSRTIEDSGTVYDPFFPWGAGGIFVAGTLGIATLDYMPFLFFAYFSTIFGLLVALTQFKVATLEEPLDTNEPQAAGNVEDVENAGSSEDAQPSIIEFRV